jgi:cell division protein FtsN
MNRLMKWREPVIVTLLVLGAAGEVRAQSAGVVSPALDRAIARARAAVDGGDGADARAVLDSLVKAAPAGSNDLAEALFWRATLAERLSDAERDWKRLVVEAPLAPRASDALQRLGEVEMLRDHPAEARTYFARVVRDFPNPATRARSQLWIAKSHVAQRDLPAACRALADASATGVPEGELRLQAEELGRRCATENGTRLAKANVPKGARYSVQLAAFETAEDAARLVKRLMAKGVEARVDGSEKPFRIRVGYFATRAGANAELAALKQKGHAGFVAEIAK